MNKIPSILVIDDSPEITDLLTKYIVNCKLGQDHCFENEFKAMDYVSKNSPDILIIDVNLKYINGFKLGDMIRVLLNCELPIIYISSNKSFIKDFYQADQRGTFFMHKPILKNEFKKIVNEMISSIQVK